MDKSRTGVSRTPMDNSRTGVSRTPMEKSKSLEQAFHLCHIHNHSNIINRIHTLSHLTALSIFFYYRASLFFFKQTHTDDKANWSSVSLLPLLVISISEILLSFIWFLGQAYRWHRVSRCVFPERLPEDIDDKLPGIDVFICTVDSIKEPTIGVMNTLISAVSLDYPPEKLNVYLSDDGDSSITLSSVREAWNFAKSWVPFCRRFGIKNRCPQAYFLSKEDDDFGSSTSTITRDFMFDKQNIKEKYEQLKERVGEYTNDGQKRSGSNTTKDHPAFIEVMKEICSEDVESTYNFEKMPNLIYVSREKRSFHPHNFKAGALNVLQRVSGVISNSAYILVLDCDMYSNDPTSAKRAMCFHLDTEISPSLAFVQFPQRFHNISSCDIYDSQLRSTFSVLWEGMDGLRGPCVSGTCFFIKRVALYGSSTREDLDLMELKKSFGSSNEFIESIVRNYKPNIARRDNNTSPKELQLLASCTYENGTKWGEEVGFLYGSVLEDYLTSMTSLHSKGWTSVYCNPTRPQFLGCGTTNLNELLIQGTRWYSGLIGVGFSKYCPLIFGAFRKLSLLQTMCYAYMAFFPLNFLPLLCFASIPQLCLFNGIPLYPEVSSPFFLVLIFIYLSNTLQHLYEVLNTGATFQTWINEQRIWMIKSVTSHLYGAIDAFMSKIGLREASFLPTNKVEDDEQVLLYQMGIFDFRTSTMFLVPMVSLFILNMIAFLVGIARVMIFEDDLKKMFVQVFITIYILVLNYPIFEGMVIRKDKGCIPLSVSLLSALFTIIFIFLGSIIFI